MGRTKPKAAESSPSLLLAWVLVASVVLLAIIVRIRLLGMPLERDEGEFAYMGQLILKGIPPYELAYSMKLPGIYAVYALVMSIFGQTEIGIHIGFLLANLTACVLIFLIGRRLWNVQVGLISAAAYSMLSLGSAVMGTSAHATQFLIPAVLGAILLALRSQDREEPGILFWSGLLFGLAFTIKQHAFLFSLFAVFYLLWQCIRSRQYSVAGILKRIGLLTGGAALPFAIACLIMFRAGVFDKFWFWTFDYAHGYISEVSLSEGMNLLTTIARPVAALSAFLFALAAIGLIALLCDRKLREHASFLIGLLVFSFLAVCPGLYFREHYWIQLMPALSLLTGVGIAWMSALLRRWSPSAWLQAIPLLIFAIAVAYSVSYNRSVWFAASPEEATRIIYRSNPFPESAMIARYIKENSDPTDRIAVLGSEPEIYFHADRLSATGHIYMYGLMEKQPFARGMQEELISQIEENRPRYIVYVSVLYSWMPKGNSEKLLVDWAPVYTSAYYKVVGVADMLPQQQTEYVWGDEAESYTPQSPDCIYVFERRQGM